MRLRHIEVFNAIMLTGSVSAAARMLNVSQPAVTRVLQHAEMNLDFPLFRRDHGRLVATEEAIALHAEVEKLFVQLDAVRRLSNNLRKGGSGQLRVPATPSLAQSLPKGIFRNIYSVVMSLDHATTDAPPADPAASRIDA